MVTYSSSSSIPILGRILIVDKENPRARAFLVLDYN